MLWKWTNCDTMIVDPYRVMLPILRSVFVLSRYVRTVILSKVRSIRHWELTKPGVIPTFGRLYTWAFISHLSQYSTSRLLYHNVGSRTRAPTSLASQAKASSRRRCRRPRRPTFRRKAIQESRSNREASTSDGSGTTSCTIGSKAHNSTQRL